MQIYQKTQKAFWFTCFSKSNGTTWNDCLYTYTFTLVGWWRLWECFARDALLIANHKHCSYPTPLPNPSYETHVWSLQESKLHPAPIHQLVLFQGHKATPAYDQHQSMQDQHYKKVTLNIRESKPFVIHVCCLPRYCSAHIAKIFVHHVLGKGKAVHTGNPSE